MKEIPKHDPYLEVINARGNSPVSHRERSLSNFSPHPLKLNGRLIANVEAFVQGVKFPEGEDREEIFRLDAREAKRRSPADPPSVIEWSGASMEYGSHEHYRLQAAVIFSKFDQNEEALEALLATGELEIRHNTGTPEKPNTCLPAVIFTQILTETRAYFFSEAGISAFAGDKPAEYITPDIVAYSRDGAWSASTLRSSD